MLSHIKLARFSLEGKVNDSLRRNTAPTADNLLSAQHPEERQKLLFKGRWDGSAPWSVVGEDRFGSQWGKKGKGQPGLALQLRCVVGIPCKSELSCLRYNSGCHHGSPWQSDDIQNCTKWIKNDMRIWCPKIQVSWWQAQLWAECVGAPFHCSFSCFPFL